MSPTLSPAHIMQTATGFWSSKVLLTAVGLDLFTQLAGRPMTAHELGAALGLHPRGTYDFFDALVALKFLHRDGDGPQGRYRNTPETAAFLVKGSPTYVGGLPAMLNDRLFGFWNDLGTALKTGQPQNEMKHGGGHGVFETLYADPHRLEQFLQAMTGFQAANFQALAEAFDFGRYRTVCDLGGALALLSRIVGRRHPHLQLTSFDLPQVQPLAEKAVAQDGMSARIHVVAGDFFADALPAADVITMGNILHDWNLEKKKLLIAKAYAALPPAVR